MVEQNTKPAVVITVYFDPDADYRKISEAMIDALESNCSCGGDPEEGCNLDYISMQTFHLTGNQYVELNIEQFEEDSNEEPDSNS